MPGHLAVWIEPSPTPSPPRFWLIAAVPAPVIAGMPYRYTNNEGIGLVGIGIDGVARSAAKLDELRAQVVEAVESGRSGSPRSSLSKNGRPEWVEH